jgi:hypothetical protein
LQINEGVWNILSEMAAAASTPNLPGLIEQSFKEENDKIRRAYLEHGCLLLAENVWRKWHLKVYGEEFVEEVSDESDDDTDDFETVREEETPLWVNCYLNQSEYIPPEDDIEDNDDELDSERRIAIDVPKDDIGGAHFRNMIGMFGMLGKEKRPDEVVKTFLSSLNEKTDAYGKNKKKLFKLKIKLLNTKENIYRTVQVNF